MIRQYSNLFCDSGQQRLQPPCPWACDGAGAMGMEASCGLRKEDSLAKAGLLVVTAEYTVCQQPSPAWTQETIPFVVSEPRGQIDCTGCFHCGRGGGLFFWP